MFLWLIDFWFFVVYSNLSSFANDNSCLFTITGRDLLFFVLDSVFPLNVLLLLFQHNILSCILYYSLISFLALSANFEILFIEK